MMHFSSNQHNNTMESKSISVSPFASHSHATAADSTDLPSFKFFWWAPYFFKFLQERHFSRSKSSKVIDFGTHLRSVAR